jgi:hypothetical protein
MTQCPGCGKPMRLDALLARSATTRCYQCEGLRYKPVIMDQCSQRIHEKDKTTAKRCENNKSPPQPADQTVEFAVVGAPKMSKHDEPRDLLEMASSMTSTAA